MNSLFGEGGFSGVQAQYHPGPSPEADITAMPAEFAAMASRVAELVAAGCGEAAFPAAGGGLFEHAGREWFVAAGSVPLVLVVGNAPDAEPGATVDQGRKAGPGH